MRNIYILDTSVLIYDPLCYTQFIDSDVVIHITVLDELDKLKKLPNDAGRNARVVARLLDEISDKGDIHIGVLLDNDVLLKIDTNNYEYTGDALYGDTRILSCAIHTYKNNANLNVILVSNDINMRVRAKASGILSISHEKKDLLFSDLYSGIRLITHEQAGSDLLSSGSIDIKNYGIELHPNECVAFQDEFGSDIAKGRQINNTHLKMTKRSFPWGLTPRNREQEFAIDLLMDYKVPLVTMVGNAGCGKSLVALAAALDLVLEKRAYNKLIIYRPIQPVGNDIGFLPGFIEEKLAPWFQAVMDNFEILFTSSNGGDRWKVNFEAAKKKDKIQMEAITYIRGRSIPNALILVDEAQNLSKEEVKTILTRVGENTKIIFNGDISQIDNSFLDAANNGMSYLIEKFKTSNLAGHVTFTKGERSLLASEAARIL
jgi:PhoH-like ATPase